MSGSGRQQEAPFQPLAFEDFSGGLNTDASRPGIDDRQLYISDGFMPVGASQLRTIPDVGTAIFYSGVGKTIPFFDFANITATPYMVVLKSDGSVWLQNTQTPSYSQVAGPGTITTPSRATCGMSQWGSSAIILVSQQPNGYFVLDGSLFYQPGTISPFDSDQIDSGGSGYTGTPTYTVFGGAGSGVALTPVFTEGSLTSFTITNPGSGFLPGDIVQVGFSGGGTDTTPILEAVLASGVLSYLTLVSGGSGYPSGTFALGFSGGGGSGATGTFTTSGGAVQSVALTAGGSGYTSAPSVTFPIPGSGASITATESGGIVVSLTIVAGGSGYVPGTYPLAFTSGTGTGASATYTVNASGVVASTTLIAGGVGYATNPTVSLPAGSGASVVAAITPGAIASVTIVYGGTNLNGTPTLTVEGGGGSGATLTATVSGGAISAVTVTNGGSGYTSTPAIVVAPGFNDAAYVTLGVMPFGISGSAIETYQSRVWVVNPYSTAAQGSGGTVFFSAPQSYTDFSTANGGGSFTSNDSFLRVSQIQPKQANGFLYLIADSSLNYIAGVSTSGNPPTTSFTNQNADPEVGSPYAGTVNVLGSNIVFANAFGAHVSYGGRVTKISTPLDGIYNSVANNFGGFQLTAAKHILYGKKVWVLLVPIIDQVTGAQVNKLFFWDEKRWWSSNQGVTLTYIQHQEIASILTAYGTDGTYIYPLFTTPSTAFTKTAQSKFWARPGGYMQAKSTNRVWLLAQYYATGSPNITVSADNETGGSTVTLTPTPVVGTIYVAPPTAIGQNGYLAGITVSTNAADMALISAMIDAVPVGYKG